MGIPKGLSQDGSLVFPNTKTNTAGNNCQSTALTTAVFYFTKFIFECQSQQL